MAELVKKYQQYEEYKESGVEWLGFIPKDWNIARVKNQFDVFNGSTPKSGEAEYWEGNIVWVTPSDLSQLEGYKISESSRNITTKGLHSCGTSLVPKGSMILSCRAPIGSLAVAGTELCTNQGCKTLVPTSGIPVEYYYYYFSTVTNVLNNLGRGSTFLELSTEDLTNLAMPLPSISESYSIVEFLDFETAQIDTLIEKQQTLIQLLKEKRQAVISHAVTKGLNPDAPMKDSGVEWLGEVPEHWTVSFVKYIVLGEKDSMVDGPFGSSVNTSEDYVDDGIPVIRTVNITNNGFSSDNLKFMRQQKFDQLKRHSVKPGDVLFSKVGTIGNACLLPSDIPEAILSTTGSCKISVDQNKIEGEYLVLMFHLMNQTLMEMANSNVQPFLNMSNIKNLKISLPSIEEQKNILTYLEEKLEGIDDLIAKSLSFDKLIRERRTALISAAVTGKIDVRGWRAPESNSILESL